MKNKKFYPLHLIPVMILIGGMFLYQDKPRPEIRREPTAIKKNLRKQPDGKKFLLRQSQQKRTPASTHPYDRFAIDKKVERDTDIPLSSGNVVAKNIGAMPLADWKPGMKHLLFDDGVYGYFEKGTSRNSIPVAWNPRLRRFTPISSVLHIRGVDQGLRNQLKSQGHEEYYYFPGIRKLSLKSSPGEILGLYEKLRKEGYSVKLDVLDRTPKAN